MSSKEWPSIRDKFSKNLRDKAAAAVIPLAILLPPTLEQSQEQSVSYSGNVVSGYENVITTFAPKAPEVQMPPNEIVSFQKPLEQQMQVFDGSAEKVIEGIAERRLSRVPLYSQSDPRWGWMRYGTANMADSGCGPTSLAMVISYYKGRPIYPPETAKVALKHGWRIPYQGTSHEAMDEMPELYGLESKRVSWTEAKKALKQGKPVIQAHDRGYFTSSGHILVLTKGSDGRYKVNDPGPRHRTHATERQVKDSLMGSWIISEK